MKLKRLLRVIEDDNSEVDVPTDKVGLSTTPQEDLEELYSAIRDEIKRKNEKVKGKVRISWEGTWSGNSEEKRPYLAILKPQLTQIFKESEKPSNEFTVNLHVQKSYNFLFLDLVRERAPHLFKYYFDGYLQIDTILKGRVSVGETYFYMVGSKGLTKISEIEAVKKLNKFKSTK